MSKAPTLVSFVEGLPLDDAAKSQVFDLFDGMPVEEIQESTVEELIEAGLDAETAAILKGTTGDEDDEEDEESKQGTGQSVDGTSIQDWTTDTLCAYFKTLPFLKGANLSKALQSAQEEALDGEAVVQASLEELAEVVPLSKIHVRRIWKSVQERVAYESQVSGEAKTTMEQPGTTATRGEGQTKPQNIEETPVEEWETETVIIFMRSLAFLRVKPHLLSNVEKSVKDQKIAGSWLLKATSEQMGTALSIGSLHAKRIVQAVKERAVQDTAAVVVVTPGGDLDDDVKSDSPEREWPPQTDDPADLELVAFIDRITAKKSAKRDAFDALEGFAVADVEESTIPDLQEMGLDAEIAALVKKATDNKPQCMDEVPMRQWHPETVCAFLKSLTFLKGTLLQTALKCVIEENIDGEMLAEASLEELKESLHLKSMHVKKVFKAIRRCVDEQSLAEVKREAHPTEQSVGNSLREWNPDMVVTFLQTRVPWLATKPKLLSQCVRMVRQTCLPGHALAELSESALAQGLGVPVICAKQIVQAVDERLAEDEKEGVDEDCDWSPHSEEQAELASLIDGIAATNSDKRAAFDALSGFAVQDIIECNPADLTIPGLHPDIAAMVKAAAESLQSMDETPFVEWNSHTVCAFLRRLSFLNGSLLQTALQRVREANIDGEMLAEASAEHLKESLHLQGMHANKLLKLIKQKIAETRKETPLREWDSKQVAAFLKTIPWLEKREEIASKCEQTVLRIDFGGGALADASQTRLVKKFGVSRKCAQAIVQAVRHKLAEEQSLSGDDDEKKDDPRRGIIPCPVIDARQIRGAWKTILVVGETGTGKSTTLNSLTNFLMGVKQEDKFRYKLIVEERAKNQAQSVTQDVKEYHIRCPNLPYGLTVVDTPGFGDCAGLEKDKEIMKKIEECFKNRVVELNAVCFTIRAGCARLTIAQRYVYATILGIFGNDIKKNLFMLITFCDGNKPPVMAAIREADIPFVRCVKLNNSAFFCGFDENMEKDDIDVDIKAGDDSEDLSSKHGYDSEPEDFTSMFWNMGMKAFAHFFTSLEKVDTTSLCMTKEVLKERENLELCIVAITHQIQLGLDTLECIRQTMKEVKDHERDINANADIHLKVKKPKIVQTRCPEGTYTTTCRLCQWTCHRSCAYFNDDDKRKCSAMKNGLCTACPKKCGWQQHSNVPYWIEHTMEEEMTPVLSKKEALEAAAKGMCFTEAALRKYKDQFIDTQDQVYLNITKVRDIQAKLQKIALRPQIIEEDDHFDLMIEAERTGGKKGWQHRIKAIEVLKQRARHLRDITQGDCSMQWEQMSEELQKIDADIAAVRERAERQVGQHGFWKGLKTTFGWGEQRKRPQRRKGRSYPRQRHSQAQSQGRPYPQPGYAPRQEQRRIPQQQSAKAVPMQPQEQQQQHSHPVQAQVQVPNTVAAQAKPQPPQPPQRTMNRRNDNST